MNKKTYQQLKFEPYFEQGVAKLRYKEPLRKDIFPPAVQEMAELILKSKE